MTKEKQIELAANLLHLSIEQAQANSEIVDDDGTLYVALPEKGADALLVAKDGSVLYAMSVVSFHTHYEEFKKGRRTPLEAFK